MLLAGDIVSPSFLGPPTPRGASPAFLLLPWPQLHPPASWNSCSGLYELLSSSSFELRAKGSGESQTDAWSGQVDASSAVQGLEALLMGRSLEALVQNPVPFLVMYFYQCLG